METEDAQPDTLLAGPAEAGYGRRLMLHRLARIFALAAVGLVPLWAEVGVTPARAQADAAAQPAPGTPVLYDLRPYAEVEPVLAQARAALERLGGADQVVDGDPEVATAVQAALVALTERLDAPLPPATSPWRDPLTRDAARWLRATLQRRSGLPELARADLQRLVDRGSSLADLARRALAEDLIAAGDPLGAAAHLLAVTPGTQGHEAACVEAAGLVRGTPQVGRAAAVLDDVLTHALASGVKARLTLLTAELKLEAGERARAVRLLEALWWAEGDGAYGQKAWERLEALDATPAFEATLARRVLHTSASKAEEARRELAALKGKGAARKRALAWAEAVLGRWDEGTRLKGIGALAELRAKVAGTALEPWFLFGQAEVLRKQDLDYDAAEAYRALADGWPDHVLAEEALVEAAGLLAREGLHLDADALYQRAAQRGHRGRAHRLALWNAGFAAHLRGGFDEAIVHLTRVHDQYGGERDALGILWAERAGYWLARSLERAGQREQALSEYGELIERFPLGWYAILAGQRRDALLGTDAPALVLVPAEDAPMYAMVGLPPRPDELTGLRVVRRPKLDVAVALLRLGDEAGAREALGALFDAGQLPGTGRALLAALHRRAGQAFSSARVLKSDGVLVEVPQAEDEDLYGSLFPFEHRELIEQTAADNGLNPALLAGLVYVESRYKANVVSGAGAIGLTQLMPATARSIARHLLGKQVSTRTLRNPKTNLEIGARYLAELLEHFGGNPALALAGYNAGSGAVRGWMRKRGHLETDAFVETIPYEQARSYVRRVVAVSQVYRAMYGVSGPRVDVPMRLPMTLGPFMGKRR